MGYYPDLGTFILLACVFFLFSLSKMFPPSRLPVLLISFCTHRFKFYFLLLPFLSAQLFEILQTTVVGADRPVVPV